MIGYVVLTLLIFLAGVLAGIKMAWLDAYYKGREDAKPSFSIYERQNEWDAAIDARMADVRLSSTRVPTGFE